MDRVVEVVGVAGPVPLDPVLHLEVARQDTLEGGPCASFSGAAGTQEVGLCQLALPWVAYPAPSYAEEAYQAYAPCLQPRLGQAPLLLASVKGLPKEGDLEGDLRSAYASHLDH